jgi:adenine phosphoribosyltransferase
MTDTFDLTTRIARIPDFPKPGILFYDISPLLADGAAWRETVRRLAACVGAFRPDLLIGIESRGFLAAAPLAYELGIGFAMIRKRGKLPGGLLGHDYALEYGTDRVEIQADAVKPGQRVVVLDDLLATGGTMAAATALLRRCGAEVVAAAFIIELGFLGGRQVLDVPVEALMRFD